MTTPTNLLAAAAEYGEPARPVGVRVHRTPVELSEFGPTLDAYLTMAKAQQTARALSLAVQHDPEPDKVLKRRMRRWDEAHQARAKAIQAKDRDALSAANSSIRALQREIRERRMAQLQAVDSSRAALEATVMASIRGEPIEEVDTLIVDWARDENGARKIVKGNAVLVEERGRALRVANRTGLALAYVSGHLDGGAINADKLYDIGKRYREAFETIGRAGNPDADGRNSTPSGKPSLGPGDVLLIAAKTLGTLRRGLTARQRQVLDMVCGQDFAVKATAVRMRAGLPATKRALVAGLSMAWKNKLADAQPVASHNHNI